MTHEAFKTVALRIHGRVQGVWYRGWTVEQARRLGLTGWVRNRSDGTVEAVVHGPVDQVEEMLRLCHDGPPAAKVSRIDQASAPVPGSDSFEQRATY